MGKDFRLPWNMRMKICIEKWCTIRKGLLFIHSKHIIPKLSFKWLQVAQSKSLHTDNSSGAATLQSRPPGSLGLPSKHCWGALWRAVPVIVRRSVSSSIVPLCLLLHLLALAGVTVVHTRVFVRVFRQLVQWFKRLKHMIMHGYATCIVSNL